MTKRAFVTIIDDDESVRESLSGLLIAAGYDVEVYESAESYLRNREQTRTTSLIVDVCMPNVSGPELQKILTDQGESIPTIFISAKSNPELQKSLLERGAVAYLVKPFGEEALLDALGNCEQGGEHEA